MFIEFMLIKKECNWFYFWTHTFKLFIKFFHIIRKSKHFQAENFMFLVAGGCHIDLKIFHCHLLFLSDKFHGYFFFNQDSYVLFIRNNEKCLSSYLLGKIYNISYIQFSTTGSKTSNFVCINLKISFFSISRRKKLKRHFSS